MKKLNGVVALMAAFALMFGIVSCNPNADEMEKTVKVTGITLNKTELTLTAGGKETLTATVKPDNATDKTVTWTSDKTDIATVSAGGEVTAVAKGSAKITATAGGKSATCTVTVNPLMYSVTVTGGTANPAAAEAGATITITANDPTTGKEFDTWTTTTDGVTFADASNATTTFTMPSKAVIVTATYKDADVETKAKPDTVGDVVLSDGTAVAYENLDKMSSAQKASAIAVIFYVGTGETTVGSNENILGAKVLGVGLQNTQGEATKTLMWAPSGTTGNSTNFKDIRLDLSRTAPVENTTYYKFTYSGIVFYLTGDFDGSDNWDKVCEQDSAGSADAAVNYPAFNWANSYAVSNAIMGSSAKGWYLPSGVELRVMYDNKAMVNAALEKVGGTKIADKEYWSSSQRSSYGGSAYNMWFQDGNPNCNAKEDSTKSVCAIRKF